jgi:hypothetical protein
MLTFPWLNDCCLCTTKFCGSSWPACKKKASIFAVLSKFVKQTASITYCIKNLNYQAMKYAFIMGSNSFIVPGNTLVYTDHNINFLRINSIYQDRPAGQGSTVLDVDLDIKDTDGTVIKINKNEPAQTGKNDVAVHQDRLHITRPDGNTIIDIHQMDEDSAMRLEHNIIAELEALAPDVVIRIRGNFMVDDLHLEIDNEKLFVNGNAYANSTQTGKLNIQFHHDSVEI